MKKHFLINIISLAAILTACAPQRLSTPTQVKITSTEAVISTPTVERIASPTSAISIKGTFVPPPTEPPQLQEECITLESKLPKDLVLSGAWVVDRDAPYLEKLDDHMKYAIPVRGGGSLNGYNGDMAISPDGLHMAYIDEYYETAGENIRAKKRLLRVINSSGHELNMNYWSQDWQSIIGWVDNENIAISTTNLMISTAKTEIIILNPLTGNWRKFQQPAWAVSNDKATHYYWNYYPYSPTLTWFQDQSDNKSMVLKNVKTSETALTLNHPGGAIWSRNGAGLAIFSGKSIIMINNGKQEGALDTSAYTQTGQLALSPDGTKLVFNSRTAEKYSDNQLTAFDITQHRLGRLCADGFDAENWSDPVWSPDNRFVTASISMVDYPYTSFGILIDTQEMRAYTLDRYSDLPLAWLAKP